MILLVTRAGNDTFAALRASRSVGIAAYASTSAETAVTDNAGAVDVSKEPASGEQVGPGVGRQWQAQPGPATDGQARAWKLELFRKCATGNRGLTTSPAERTEILRLLEQLEGNFVPPSGADLRKEALEGSWSLIFTTSPDLTSLDRLPLPGWRTARIGQAFGPGRDAQNEITLMSPFGTRIEQTVNCEWGPLEPADGNTFKAELKFVGSSTKLAEVVGFEPPLPPLSIPLPPGTGVFQVSYVDDEVLVVRTGAAGGLGVNVLTRDNL